MSPKGTKLPTNSSIPAKPLSHSYKEASTSRWQLLALFQSFLEDRPADTMLAVQERRLLVSWDLKALHYLRRCLRTWILDQVPGDAIGAFLVTVLYEQDFHLDYRLTMMVREGQSQLHIARRLLAFYQIRDQAGAPIWDNVAVYAENAHWKPPGQGKSVSGRFDATKELPPLIPTLPPADARWPLFLGALSDPELEDLMDKLGDEGQHEEEDLPPLFTGVREEDIPIIQAFRRFNLHKNDFSQDIPLPVSGTDRIEYTSKQTNILQDKPLPPIPMKKPLPILPINKPLPHNFLPLPPLSRPSSPNPSSVRVSTFKSEKKPKIQRVDYIAGEHANIEQRKGKNDLRSSATSRLRPTPRVNVNQYAPHPPGITCIPCHLNCNAPPPLPKLKKKAGIEDLRKARECGG
ncbi:hypothetical protein N7447_006532 [Penicillium robsamsonii]|uniref:uncharacterized protein n=1 Tax=Penicillium robsamsonii TaxID=1792511 RepID=UPI002549A458|nr:uncharacterized protein N7447_006532 [Penicillium robsamsonii]KAJ5824192.1 hypothetical protein N7447_006532 [Penicillium robsamsonii]